MTSNENDKKQNGQHEKSDDATKENANPADMPEGNLTDMAEGNPAGAAEGNKQEKTTDSLPKEVSKDETKTEQPSTSTPKDINQSTMYSYGLYTMLFVQIVLLVFLLYHRFGKQIFVHNVQSSESEPQDTEMPQQPQPTQPSSLGEADKEKTSIVITDKWLVVGASSIGLSHLDDDPQTPCQDSHEILDLGDGWGIAVSCDGAGSYKHSHLGSRFVSEALTKSLAKTVAHFKWKESGGLPDEYEWQDIAKGILSYTYSQLVNKSKELGIDDVEQLSSTIIMVVYSPVGLLVSHIGDGRACYLNQNREWIAMIKPFSGDDGGTVFLPTDFVWKKFSPTKGAEQNNLIRTCLSVFAESRVINEEVKGFALMSDGCEPYLYEPKKPYPSLGGKYLDINQPNQHNLTAVVKKVGEAFNKHKDEREQDLHIKNELLRILQHENGFRNEQDDKTLVIGLFHESDHL